MFEYVDFTRVEGRDTGKNLRLFALTTCGFCKRAISFLNESGVAYSYAHVDSLGPDIKQQAKDEFMKKFEKKMLFPTLMIDEDDYLPGFIRLHWEKIIKE